MDRKRNKAIPSLYKVLSTVQVLILKIKRIHFYWHPFFAFIYRPTSAVLLSMTSATNDTQLTINHFTMINDNHLKPGNQDKGFALVSETAARATMDHNGFNNAFFNGRITQLVQLIVIYNDCQFQTKRYIVPALHASSVQTKTITFVSVLYHTGHLNSSSLACRYLLAVYWQS